MTEEFWILTICDDTWCYATVVTSQELIYGILKQNRSGDLAAALESGKAPAEAIKSLVPLGNPYRVLPLCNVRSLSWYDDKSFHVAVSAEDKRNKTTRVSVQLPNVEKRDEFIEYIVRRTGRLFNEELRIASVWYAGISTFLIFGFLSLLYGGIAIAAFDPRVNKGGVRSAWMAELGDALGPVGAVALGIGLMVTFAATWGVQTYRRPRRHVLTVQDWLTKRSSQHI
ncbi:MAG: hypothetical protein M3552_15970 [Planctomycetota bacterium]|nr:hypothetical protein [Planctomycetota bacterium]